jgi:hypothetical protein
VVRPGSPGGEFGPPRAAGLPRDGRRGVAPPIGAGAERHRARVRDGSADRRGRAAALRLPCAQGGRGKTKKGALRCLKRHLARRFHQLLSPSVQPRPKPHHTTRTDTTTVGAAPMPMVCLT